ncbi:MAG: hydroxyacylglutathione hydrolase [Flavobacteriales bacterium]|jgi:hydroxyacylglutathione hydrolase
MKVHQIYTHSELRNFSYLIEMDNRSCLVIDPWSAELVNGYLQALNLTLHAVINTHEHWDHVQGNLALVAQHECEVWGHVNGQGKIPGLSRCLKDGELIDLGDDVELRVMDTPGHTMAHLCFKLINHGRTEAVFTGDCLFNAGVGHCRSGDPEVFYGTITSQFHTLSDEVLVYPGHDYLQNNLAFTLHLEPSNVSAKQWLSRIDAAGASAKALITCIADEREINTFFRLDSVELRDSIKANGFSEKQTFVALRAERDSW